MEISLAFETHPSEDLLEEYAFGRLADDAALEEHLLLCVACQNKLDEIDRYIRLMKAATRMGALPPSRTASLPRRAVLATAALALAACVVLGISLRPAPAVASARVSVASFRGGGEIGAADAPAGTPLDLTIEAVPLTAGTQYRIEIVTAFGKPAWSGASKPENGSLSAHVPLGLRAGMYWVRVFDAHSNLLSESGLLLR